MSRSKQWLKVSICAVSSKPQPNLKRFAKSLKVACDKLLSEKLLPPVELHRCHLRYGPSPELKKFVPDIVELTPVNSLTTLLPHANFEAFNQMKADVLVLSATEGLFHPDTLTELVKCYLNHPLDLIDCLQFPQQQPKPYNPDTFFTDWASGYCMLIARELNLSVGSFDMNLSPEMAAIDYSWRTRLAGHAVRVCPGAKYCWPFQKSWIETPDLQNYFESARYLGHKWQNGPFRNWCEQELLKSNKSETMQFPQLFDENVIGGHTPEQIQKVADFKFDPRFVEIKC